MSDSVNAQLSSFIATEILKDPSRTLDEHETLISSGLVDSFSLVDLALFVEDTFGVQIDDTELTASVFDSIEELSAIITARQST